MSTRRSDPAGHDAWQDLSGLLPQSRGWMHSGVAVLSDGRILCAHPEGHELLVIDPSGRVESLQTSLTEMHSIVTCERDGREVIAVADPGHRFVEDPADPSAYADHFAPGRAALLNRDGSVLLELECPPLPDYATEQWRPTSIAVDDSRYTGTGEIWVADGYGASLLHRFDASGRHLATMDGSETGTAFACPHGILPSSLVLVGDRLYVTELFGGVVRFDGGALTGVLERGRPRSNEDEAWPNRRTPSGLDGPVVGPEFFNSPHGITADDEWLYVTEWFIGGRLSRLSLTQY